MDKIQTGMEKDDVEELVDCLRIAAEALNDVDHAAADLHETTLQRSARAMYEEILDDIMDQNKRLEEYEER